MAPQTLHIATKYAFGCPPRVACYAYAPRPLALSTVKARAQREHSLSGRKVSASFDSLNRADPSAKPGAVDRPPVAHQTINIGGAGGWPGLHVPLGAQLLKRLMSRCGNQTCTRFASGLRILDAKAF